MPALLEYQSVTDSKPRWDCWAAGGLLLGAFGPFVGGMYAEALEVCGCGRSLTMRARAIILVLPVMGGFFCLGALANPPEDQPVRGKLLAIAGLVISAIWAFLIVFEF
jgi:hypothetical protein